MKTLLTLVFTIMFSSTSFADWTKVTESEIGNHYVDFDTIKKQDNFVYFWALFDLLKPDKDGDFSYKNYKQGDCKLFRFKSLSFAFHKEPMGGGPGETGNPKNPEWNYPSPNSGDQMTLSSVCSK
jgi:hypothetical protein